MCLCVYGPTLVLFFFLPGHPNMGGPMRMNPPRGMAMGPQVQIRKLEEFFPLFRLIQIRFEFSHIFLRPVS